MSYGYRPKQYVIIEKAPWPYEKVQELNKFQDSCVEHESPYVCPHHGNRKPKLRATVAGWECQENTCSFKQDHYYGESLVI